MAALLRSPLIAPAAVVDSAPSVRHELAAGRLSN
jgi:hypothetical protein